MFVGKHKLPLNSPSIVLELRGQKSGYQFGWLSRDVGGREFTFGWRLKQLGILNFSWLKKLNPEKSEYKLRRFWFACTNHLSQVFGI